MKYSHKVLWLLWNIIFWMKLKPLWKLFQPVTVFIIIIYIAKMLKDVIISKNRPFNKNVPFLLMGLWKLLSKYLANVCKTYVSDPTRTKVSVKLLAIHVSKDRESTTTDETWAAAGWTKKTRKAFSIQITNSFVDRMLNFVLTQRQCRKSWDA